MAEYNWQDCRVVVGGRNLVGFTKISYKGSQEVNEVRGKGFDPISLQRGQKSYEGSITLNQSELESLQEAAGAGDIMDLTLDITVAYVGTIVKTDIILGAKITEIPKEMAFDAANMTVELPFKALKINYNQ